jgi:hypothetical protein
MLLDMFYFANALIIASGGHFIKKLPGIENAIIPCEGLSSVEKIRDKLKEMETLLLSFKPTTSFLT